MELDFTPVPTMMPLFLCGPEKRYLFVLGPLGSTKTTSCLMWLMIRAASQEPSPDGLRRSRFGILRNTLASLKQTVLKDILALFRGIADWRPSANTVFINVGDVRSEWVFLPLETDADIKRLGSLQLSGVYINEVREVEWGLVIAAFSRTGRFPSNMHGGVACTWRFVIADSNLGVEGSPLHKFLENPALDDAIQMPGGPVAGNARTDEQSQALLYIHQPSALSADADWTHLLPNNYYSDAMLGATGEWIRQFVLSEWGHDLSGEAVYGRSFQPSTHVATARLTAFQGKPLLIGVDHGLNPAAVIAQLAPNGALHVLQEVWASNLLFRAFVAERLLPSLAEWQFQGCRLLFVIDPASRSRTALTQDTAFGVLKEFVGNVVVAPTNDLSPRLRSVERFLMETRTGIPPQLAAFDPKIAQTIYPQASHQPASNHPTAASTTPASAMSQSFYPALLIDPACKYLIQAMGGRYRYVRNQIGELKPEPEKLHPWSDLCDSLQYICLQLSSPRFMQEAGGDRRLGRDPTSFHMRKPGPSALGWT